MKAFEKIKLVAAKAAVVAYKGIIAPIAIPIHTIDMVTDSIHYGPGSVLDDLKVEGEGIKKIMTAKSVGEIKANLEH